MCWWVTYPMPNADTTDDATDEPTIEAGHVLRPESTGKIYDITEVDADADALHVKGRTNPASLEMIREDISDGHTTLFTPVNADE